MEHHRPSLTSMQPGVPYMRHPYKIPYLHPQPLHKKTPSCMIRMMFLVMSCNSSVFEMGEVVAFRGTDGLVLNLLRVTNNVSLCSLGPRSRVRGDFLVETARDDNNICYSLDPNWKNASMVYAHANSGMETAG